MKFYYETSESKGFRGTPRGTLVSTLSRDIKRVLEWDLTFPLQPTKTTADRRHARQLAKDRIYWKKAIVGAICSAAEAAK